MQIQDLLRVVMMKKSYHVQRVEAQLKTLGMEKPKGRKQAKVEDLIQMLRPSISTMIHDGFGVKTIVDILTNRVTDSRICFRQHARALAKCVVRRESGFDADGEDEPDVEDKAQAMLKFLIRCMTLTLCLCLSEPRPHPPAVCTLPQIPILQCNHQHWVD